jgi:hypothetical protein
MKLFIRKEKIKEDYLSKKHYFHPSGKEIIASRTAQEEASIYKTQGDY